VLHISLLLLAQLSWEGLLHVGVSQTPDELKVLWKKKKTEINQKSKALFWHCRQYTMQKKKKGK